MSWTSRGSRAITALTTLSQFTTSITTTTLIFLVQASAGANATGAVGITLAVTYLAIAVNRAVLTQAIAEGSRGRWAGHVHAVIWANASIALLVSLSFSWSFRAELPLLWLMAASTPLMIAQDARRYLYFSMQSPATALLSDLMWLLSFAGCFAIIQIVTDDRASAIAPAWFIGASAGLIFCLLNRPATAHGKGTALTTLIGIAAESLLVQGIGQILLICLPIVASLEVAGLFRLAQSLAGPVGIATSALLIRHALASAETTDTPTVATRPGSSVLLGLAAGVGTAALLYLAPSRLVDWLQIPADSQLAASSGLVVVATTIGLGNQRRLLHLRRSRQVRHWLWRRLLAVAALPLIGLPLSSLWGVVGATTSLVVEQLVLLALLRPGRDRGQRGP